MRATAKLNYVRVSPQKARLVIDLLRGRAASEALTILGQTNKRVAPQVEKLLRSAISNAEDVADVDSADELQDHVVDVTEDIVVLMEEVDDIYDVGVIELGEDARLVAHLSCNVGVGRDDVGIEHLDGELRHEAHVAVDLRLVDTAEGARTDRIDERVAT